MGHRLSFWLRPQIMPQIDLEPSDYARRDPRTGKMVREPSKRFSRNLTFLAALMLCVIFWWRNDVTATNLFGITAFVAFCGGVMAANWLKNIY